MRRGDISGGRNLGKSRDRHGWSAIAAGRGEGLAVRLLAFLLSAVALSGAGMLLVGCQNEGEAIEASTGMTVGDNDVQPAGVAASAGGEAEAEKPVLSPEEVEVDAVRVLGIKKGEPLETGFVFIDGKYVETPYIVSRKGRGVFINDILIYKTWHPWPLPDLRVDEDPGPPTGRDAEAKSMEELRSTGKINNIYYRKMRYLYQHFPRETADRKLLEYIQALPFVESVERISAGNVSITTKEGENELVFASKPGPEGLLYTNDDLANEVDLHRAFVEEELADNSAMFLFPQLEFGSHVTSARTLAGNMAAFVAVLRSELSADEKRALLDKENLLSNNGHRGIVAGITQEEYSLLLEQFNASSQLDKRVAALAKKMNIKPHAIPRLQ